jgi:hypothetical protein
MLCMKNIATATDHYGENLESGTIRVTGLERTSFDLCSIGVVPEGREGRQVFQGPLVPGPWGYAVTHPMIIDNSGMAAAERREAQVIEVGEPFTVEGLPGTWTFVSPRRNRLDGDGPRLVAFEEAIA